MKNKNRKTISLLLLLSVIFFSCTGNKTDYSVQKVEEGPFELSVTETGELHAVNKKSFILQRYGRRWYRMKVIGLLEHGTIVQAGDSVIQLDPSEIKKYILDRKLQLETENANQEKMLVQHEIDKSNLVANLNSEEATFELSRIEYESSRFSSDNEQRVKELQFKQAEIQLNKLKRKRELIDIQHKHENIIQEIKIKQLKEDIESSIAILPQLTIRTPISGVFQLGYNRNTNSKLKLGDQIYYRTNMGDVPDMTWMKVETVLNETDIDKVKVGLPVRVKLDALDGVFFDGTVSKISTLCHRQGGESRKKVFDVIVTMNESDARLKPGMTVSCEYICSNSETSLLVPNDCVLDQNGKSFIYVLKGRKPVKTEVEIGLKNNRFTQITSGANKGSKVLPIKEIL